MLVIGIAFMMVSMTCSSMGDILYKVDHEDRTLLPPWLFPDIARRHFWVGIICTLLGEVFNILASVHLTLMTNAIGSVAKIAVAELFNVLFLGAHVTQAHWRYIASIMVTAFFAMLLSAPDEEKDITRTFEKSLIYDSVICFFVCTIPIQLSFYAMVKVAPPPKHVSPRSLYNLVGPIALGLNTMWFQLWVKIFGQEACVFTDSCKYPARPDYVCAAPLVLVLALLQIWTDSFVTGRLHITTAIPLSATCLFLFPSLLGMLCLEERPLHAFWYGIAVISMVALAVAFTFAHSASEAADALSRKKAMSMTKVV